MKETFKRVAKGLLSQIPIFFVLLDLHLKGKVKLLLLVYQCLIDAFLVVSTNPHDTM